MTRNNESRSVTVNGKRLVVQFIGGEPAYVSVYLATDDISRSNFQRTIWHRCTGRSMSRLVTAAVAAASA